MLGEKLFPRVSAMAPDDASKVTGMLLEMDNAEIINLLDSPQLLSSKVQAAVRVRTEVRGA